MSIDFATLQGLTIPEGVVTQIEDAAGNVLWSSGKTSGNVILEVEKIVSDTYAGSTTYTGEEFILLDVYPKSGGTVNVTYGGLTKSITDDGTSEEPNAQQVFFGTFNGVSDSIVTPTSGTLTIEGDYAAFGIASFNKDKISIEHFSGIKKVTDFGVVEIIPVNAFYNCTALTSVDIPNTVTSIGEWAFGFCSNLASIRIPNSVTGIGEHAFQQCHILASIRIPDSVTSIGDSAFAYCVNLTDIAIDPANENYTAENGALFTKDKKTIVAYPGVVGDYTVPNFVTSIGAYAFFGAEELTGIIIPNTVTSIGEAAFRNCTALTSVVIPNSVTSIGDAAFKLESGNSRTVTMLSATPATLGGTSVFDSAGMNNIMVPVGSGEAYRTAKNWNKYADYITEAS